MVLRSAGAAVPVDARSLAAAYPHATGRLLVLVPGAGETEDVWSPAGGSAGYAAPLAGLLDWTPAHLVPRPSSEGRAGEALAGLLQRLVEAWPVPVERIALVGHGTAAAVLGEACAVAAPWARLTRDVVVLGPGTVPAEGPLGPPTELSGARHVVIDAVEPAAPLTLVRAVRLLGGLLRPRPRAVRPVFPAAARFEVDTRDAPLTSHPEVAAALLDWLA